MLEAIDPRLLPVLAARLRALAEPQRLRLMQALSDGEKTVGELVDLTGTTQPNVTRHVQKLEQSGWIARRREGNRVYLRIAEEVSGELCQHICGLVRQQAAQTAAVAATGEERNLP
ncbi:MAG: winged helix-turn-helix transcriptional regulator [Armatimonadetes bacterium]|nr:winged helix-turn-helix transcriptional regulator [Armatimonadota bacterium]